MKLTFARKQIPLKNFFLLLIFLCTLAWGFMAFLTQFKPVFQEKAVVLARQRATEIINAAAYDVFSEMDSFDYVNIEKDESGNITSVSANTVKINQLKALVSQAVSQKSNKGEDYYLYIPIGSLTQYPVLQGVGYRIPIIVSLDGVTKTEIRDEFVDVGINQVKNKNYIVVSARISIISSIMTISEVVETQIPVTETIIVGDVPSYYGNGLGVVGR